MHDQIDILATRVDATKAAYLKKLYPNFNYDKEAKTFILKQSETIQNKGMIVVVCAGTSDIPIAREAVLTAEFLGNEVNLISDVHGGDVRNKDLIVEHMDYEDVGANSWITSDSFLEVEKITEVKNDGKTKDGI